MSTRIRWGDNDFYFGPFTYARDKYRSFTIMLGSGDGDDYPGCRLRLSGFGRTLIIALPSIIRPWARFVPVHTSIHGGYEDTHEREYGFSLSNTGMVGDAMALHLHYGPQTHDSWTTKSRCWFLPWTQWRHVRHSVYDRAGDHFYTIPEGAKWHESHDKVDACPTLTFAFDDFDGERIEAKTRIEEREWRFGAGWFKWLSWFRKPMIQRSLDIQFSKETGSEKGSWKGGTVGHSINMLPSELHEEAFIRYCGLHQMKAIGMAVDNSKTAS
jgi:hypothetical protein